jgi:5-methylcytosine-specific restriction endonuclease McrA
MKLCNKCQIHKEIQLFRKNIKSKDGLQHTCILCQKELDAQHYRKNITKYKEHNARYYSENIEIAKQYYKDNVQLLTENYKKYKQDNAGQYSSYTAKRDTAKLKRTPKWLTKIQLNEIKDIYIKASELTKLSGTKHEVDHIIPIQGKTASGLHVPWNLQILTQSENGTKGNRLLEKYERNINN